MEPAGANVRAHAIGRANTTGTVPKKATLRKFKRADLEVSEKIGKGAYGGVWQATVLDTKQEVVVKVVWPDADLDPEDAKVESPGQHRRDAFKREIEMMRRVGTHPNVIGVLGATADSTVIVFEEALTDLHVIIKKQKRSLSLPIVVRVTRDILLGVEYLHDIKVVHRDLKPANILVFKDMTCKLGDFGLAREFSDSNLTVKNEVSTLWYRAPELLMGSATYTPLIDEWSCGCITLEMLTGRCALTGRVEEVCDCPQQTHYNYNSDQLLKVFHLVGTPQDEELLSKMQCRKHFQSWPKQRATLDTMITNMCTPSRFGSSDKASPSDDRILQAVGEWVKMTGGMLTLDARMRLSASDLLAMPLLAVRAPAAAQATNNGQGAMFQRTQSVPAPPFVRVASAGPSTDAAQKTGGAEERAARSTTTTTTTTKKLLLNPFRRLTSSGSAGGGAPSSSTDSVTEKLANLSTTDRLAPKGSAAYQREQAAAIGLARRPSLPSDNLRNAPAQVGMYKTASDMQGAKRRSFE